MIHESADSSGGQNRVYSPWTTFQIPRFHFLVSSSNNQACSSAVRKPAISLADSTELRSQRASPENTPGPEHLITPLSFAFIVNFLPCLMK